ncbi:DUF3231 family protein [Clostridium psychrophilum]|uniref:DUF3231 family protein n=1 Tax=Clostridium psychrophilum TaxID=132926 RepID=UPI001C0B71B0|nr:DUF3231 family protein [Clostridium psychrophilum]MBU3182330.1 DUF3231 family protein [Clostridium psychrophilum]
MGDTNKIPLISSEIAGIWNAYMSESLTVKVLSCFLNRVEDTEIQALLQKTFELSNQHITEITGLFNQAGLPIPDGFTDNDVNINAPRLFTDSFYLAYLSFMSRIAMHNYTLILNEIARSDIRNYFSKRIYDSIDLYNQSADLRLAKGIFIRAPFVEVGKKVEYIKSRNFMVGLLGEKRSMLLNEVTQLFGLTFSNIVGRALTTAFGQVSKNAKISDYLFEGRDLTSKIISELTEIFSNDDIPIPSTSDSFVTDSTISPFSEKLILTHMLVLCSSSVSSLGMAVSESLRVDLYAIYLKYTAQIMKYSQKGAKIMIDNKWLEQPPAVLKHKDLIGIQK